MPFPERVETSRLTLRRPGPADAQALEAVWDDPHVWPALRPGLAFDPGFAPSRVKHHLAHWREHGFGLWAIDRQGEIVGCSGASHAMFVPELAHEVEIGWSLRGAFWGEGYATEAASAAVAAALSHLDVARVISLIEPRNARSAAVAARLGMAAAGSVRHPRLGVELEVFTTSRAARLDTARAARFG